MAAGGNPAHHRGVIGGATNFWLYSSENGFDLTHPAKPSDRTAEPHVKIETTTTPITIDPARSALVIVDMQNFFLSPAFGRAKGAGHSALEQLEQYAIPAARKAGIRIIWLNWGLTDQEVKDMPPAVTRAFGFEVLKDAEGVLDGHTFEAKGTGRPVDKHGNPVHQGGHTVLEDGKNKKYYGLGAECGIVEVDGKEIDAGRMLTRGAWNSALYSPLDQMYEEGAKLELRPDVWIHKNRMSGMWGAKTDCEEFLEREGIKTLMFTGVNTDQCVGGTLLDSFSKGYDCVFLSDGAGTTSPKYAQQCFDYNSANTFGFATSCKALAEGVAAMSA